MAIVIIANPQSGKDIRRLIANAATSTLQEKYTIVRRAVIGAAEAGTTEVWMLSEPHHIGERSVETLDLGINCRVVPIEPRFDESDTVRTVEKMRSLGCRAILTLGGDGTNRAATLGWREVPLVPISTGTNNVFPEFMEATIAGAAGGLIDTGSVGLDEAAERAKVIEIDIEGEGSDIALIDAVLLDERFVGSRALFDADAIRTAVLTRAEPASVGVASIGGLLRPCGASDDRGVLLEFGNGGPAVRAPLAPGLYTDFSLASCQYIELDQSVEVTGPGILAFDGERQRALADGQSATLTVHRLGPYVIDPGRALHLAATRRAFGA